MRKNLPEQIVDSIGVKVAGQKLELLQVLQLLERFQEVPHVLVNVQVDMPELGTHFDEKLQLVEAHVPGVEALYGEGDWIGAVEADVLKYLAEQVTPPHSLQVGKT